MIVCTVVRNLMKKADICRLGSSAHNRGSMRTQVFLEHETRKGFYLVLNRTPCLQFRQKSGFFTSLHGLMLCYRRLSAERLQTKKPTLIVRSAFLSRQCRIQFSVNLDAVYEN